jgi:hypothetical protein
MIRIEHLVSNKTNTLMAIIIFIKKNDRPKTIVGRTDILLKSWCSIQIRNEMRYPKKYLKKNHKRPNGQTEFNRLPTIVKNIFDNKNDEQVSPKSGQKNCYFTNI